MFRFAQSRLFTILVYVILGLLALYLLILVRPLLASVFRFLKSVSAPFFVAMIIAYVLNPVVGLLHGRKVPRTAAVLLIYAVFICSCVVIFVNVTPMVVGQVQELNEHVPEMTMKAQSLVHHFNHNEMLPESVRSGINRSVAGIEKQISERVAAFMHNIGAVVNVFFLAMIVPFLAFYMLKDMDVFERAIFKYVPRARRQGVVRLLKDIDEALGSYIRGQLLVSVCVGVSAYIGYLLIGMPYPLLMALFVALFDIIPYLGPFLGALPAMVMALTISWKMALLVAVVNTLCQFLESNIISPQVVGRSMHLHPMTIIFVLLVGGELAGIVGLLLAVPVYAALKVIAQHVSAYYIRRKTV
ncbi:AI-2E family transporter [Cohnella lubricantis]|uniref:AI-2E family transporter n=1 Tax=Cohnella lubricantis TaxID=2163172 RepID=A0A841T4T3_9BACL|nr:AI-2E family transporter [Cohnella lubricantis]MBB6675852.1 AI-2E family transporter [Cohnella lubricantis]MBP2119734.1 putative PurR-regulated permease PerM [Cohnella lubricantis]